MMYSTCMTASQEAERSLSEDFCDLTVISTSGSDRTNIFSKSYAISRTRYPGKDWLAEFCMWPGDDPNLLFPDTVYNFARYKNHWWNLMNKDGHNETHYSKIKFGPTWINQRNQQPPWLENWWFDYGLSAYSMDPYYFES